MLRFLWVDDIEEIDFEHMENNKIVEFRTCRVLFGLKPSRHLLSAVLRKHFLLLLFVKIQCRKDFQLSACRWYIDLCTIWREGIKFYNSIKTCLSAASFNLKKFSSSSQPLEGMVYSKYPEDELFSKIGMQNLFGVCRDKESNQIMYEDLKLMCTGSPTRRNLFQYFAKLFDPLGLVCPVTVEIKLLFQDVCKAKLKWHDSLSPDFQKRWEIICMHMEHLNEIMIKRCYCLNILKKLKSIPLVMHLWDCLQHVFILDLN